PLGDLYKKLFALKKKNTALWNAKWGATMIKVPNTVPTKVFSFIRQNEKEKVFAVMNFSDKPQTVTFSETLYHGKYTDYFSGETVEFPTTTQMQLKPWAYRVFVK
ncbi:MAG TPA: alpha-glucosidase C-terminal domain-containing protein, partial [Acidobacteriota bacterium]|nr:alpha-glucosidase C-terminal domain-containing protein [Acidobacteriota bacterium]